MSDCKNIHQKIIKILEKKLNSILPLGNNTLNEAMRYSAIAPGKCIRPMLMLAVTKSLNGNISKVITASSAIEIIHTYSLIHDDLPAMDNDDYRRGKLSCHKEYNEAIAILAGDSLLTLAFEILSNLNYPAEIKCKIINRVAKMIGSIGMAGGQMLDISFENKVVSEQEIIDMMSKKTGCLFAIAAEISAMLANASLETIALYKKFGLNVGILFQMQDDILDEISSLEILGKSTGKDRQAGKATLINLLGIEKAKEKYFERFIFTKDIVSDLPENDYILKFLDYLLPK